MSQVIASPAPATDAEQAPAYVVERRIAVGDALKRKYGATKEYAISLCDFLPADWFEVEHNSLREEDKPVLAEAKAFRAVLKAAGHTNPSVEWTRVRNEARKHIYPAPAGEGEGESATGPKPRKTFQLRLLDDLVALYKAGKREESLTSQQQDAMTGIVSALSALGVDVSTLVK